MPITYRLEIGRRLSNAEVDENFRWLDQNKQAASAKLTAIAGAVWAANRIMYMTGDGAVAMTDFPAAARSFLAATTPTFQRNALGLGNVDNTSDANKPVSTAQANALASKVDKVEGKGLSTNDYTTPDRDKLNSVDTGAQKNPDLVGQAEAEAGTGTGIRGWPVVRVWQSAAAWFGQSSYKKRLDESLPASVGTLAGATNKIFFNAPGITDSELTTNGQYSGSLEVREVNLVAQGKGGANSHAPGITLHYGGYAVNKLFMDSNAVLRWGGDRVLLAGDIIRGSNGNGEFVKFPDGTMICTGIIRMPAQALSADNVVTLNFPAAFISNSYNLQLTPKTVIGTGSQDAIGNLLYNGIYTGGYNLSSMTVASYSYRSAVANPVDLYFTVTGRWK